MRGLPEKGLNMLILRFCALLDVVIMVIIISILSVLLCYGKTWLTKPFAYSLHEIKQELGRSKPSSCDVNIKSNLCDAATIYYATRLVLFHQQNKNPAMKKTKCWLFYFGYLICTVSLIILEALPIAVGLLYIVRVGISYFIATITHKRKSVTALNLFENQCIQHIETSKISTEKAIQFLFQSLNAIA